VNVSLTKDEVKSAPDFDSANWDDASRTQHSDYYRSYVR